MLLFTCQNTEETSTLRSKKEVTIKLSIQYFKAFFVPKAYRFFLMGTTNESSCLSNFFSKRSVSKSA